MRYFIILMACVSVAFGAVADDDQLYMEAAYVAYDNTNAIVVASGGVEVVRGERVLIADRLYYYPQKDMVKASGNISLMQPDGQVLFADSLVLEEEFRTGIVRQFRARLADNSAFAAAEAKRLSPSVVELEKAVYSPCKICEGSDDAPLWQIKSDNVVLDAQEQSVTYRDATFEVFGTPVAYTPYFSHPTPDADRRSGILRPVYGSNSNLGFNVQVPYYINIAPDKDATLTPWMTSKEGPVLIGQYRQRTDNGYFEFNGSATFPEKRDNATGQQLPGNEFRGHIFATGQSRISKNWDWGFNINRASDDTYLRRYRFGNFDMLTSRAYTQRLDRRDYAMLEGLVFQGLEETDDPDREPVVIPRGVVHIESKPLAMNSRVSFDADSLVLTRDEGAKVRRLSTSLAYNVPYVTDGGHVLNAEVGLRGDLYDQDDVTLNDGSLSDEQEARIVPHAALSWRYPLMQHVGNAQLTVEPMATVVMSSRGHNPDTITNEDSITPEFTNLNLFDRNRFSGRDRIEEGSRAIVGVRGDVQLTRGRNVRAMVGQQIRLNGKGDYPVSNDPARDVSDIVGQVGYKARNASLDYQYRLDTQDYEFRRSEFRGSVYSGRNMLAVDYVRINDDAVLEDRDDVTASATVQAADWLGLSAFGQRDLLRDDMVIAGAGATIDYDCVTVQTNLTREFTRDRDFEPDTSITVRVGLKNLN